MKRGLSFTVSVSVLTLICGFGRPGILIAQTDAQEELRRSVWGAASEIENGNIELAKQILGEISISESTPDDLVELIARLQTTIETLESTPEQQAQNPLNTQASRQDVAAGMSREELQDYLDELSDAVRVLFDPEKSQ